MTKNQILDIVKKTGPVLPSQISAEIKTSILFASAMLSELVDKGEVQISVLKIGSSPLYYLRGQEEKLEEYLEKLNGKHQTAATLLKKKRVLQDNKLEPAIRVALREIGDFAKPVEVTVHNQNIQFWRWYALDNVETEEVIRTLLNLEQKQSSQKQQEQQPSQQVKHEKTTVSNDKKVTIPTTMSKNYTTEKQTTKRSILDHFLDTIITYFQQESIIIIERVNQKKNQQQELIISVPGKLGATQYYCLAKNKKIITESDLSTAFTQGQLRKLPALFLTTGVLNKKAEALLATDLNIHFKQL